jgi:hypothetical protein
MRWLAIATLAACSDGNGSEDGLPYEARLAGDWVGFAVTTDGPIPIDVRFVWDDVAGHLSGDAVVATYSFDIQTVESSEDAASIVMTDTNGIARVELIAHLDDESSISGHFELNRCYSTSTLGARPGCSAEGAFDLSPK